MRAVFYASPVRDEDVPKMRISFLIGWIVILGGVPWWLWSNDKFSIWWPIGLAIISVLAGWQLGYKRLIGPLFCGHAELRPGLK